MARVLTKEDEVRRPHLVEYDRDNPSPRLSEPFLHYVRSIQIGFSKRELEWLNEYEFFIFNTFDGSWTERAIPGIRPKKRIETQYVKRHSSESYRSMMNDFLEYVPPGLPEDLTDYCYMPNYRLTLVNGEKFYPICYHNDFVGWRRQIIESAKLHRTMTGLFRERKVCALGWAKNQLLGFRGRVACGAGTLSAGLVKPIRRK